MSSREEIKLTHFEDPSKFFFSFMRDERIKKSHSIQRDIAKFLGSNLETKTCSPVLGGTYGFLHLVWNAYIRVRIVSKEQNNRFRFFLIDYGYYLEHHDLSLFTELPTIIKNEPTIIKTGSLGLKPCEKIMNRETKSLVVKPVRFWEEKAKLFIKSFNRNHGPETKFYLEIFDEIEGGTFVGDIIMKDVHGTKNISKLLINDGLAMRDETVKVPTLTVPDVPVANFSKIFALLHPDFKPAEKKKTVPKSQNQPTELAAGVDFGTFTNSRMRPTLESKTHSPPKKTRVFDSGVVPPTNLMVYGTRLVAPVRSSESAPFEGKIKEALRDTLTNNVFLHSWAQILAGHSMLIVGKIQYDALCYLPPILNNFKETRNHSKNGMGPIILIVTKSSSNVKSIAKMCQQLDPELNVVSAYGMQNKKYDVIGCDIFVTTPPAFHRLSEGLTIKLFDKDRIKQLIFDGLDSMIVDFKPELSQVLRACANIQSKSKNSTQIIATSKSWIKEMSTKLMSYVPPEDFVTCIENCFEAATSSGCNISLEINSNVQEKLAKLVEILESNSYTFTRTAVVVANEEDLNYLASEIKKLSYKFTQADDKTCVKLNWLSESSGNFTILITTDSALNKMNIHNVQDLIHFTLPSNWNVFTKRFSCLLDQIYLQMQKKATCGFSSKIFLNDQNINEFVQIISFLQARNLLKEAAKFLPLIKMINTNQEMEKVQHQTPICENILVFSECKKVHCSSRHVLAEIDRPSLHLPINSCIHFELVSVKSPTCFVIKITSQITDSNSISWKEKNNKTEKILNDDLQLYFSKLENQKRFEVKVGDVGCLQTNGKWHRCRVMDIKNQMAVVSLIDTGKQVPCYASRLTKLPKQFLDLDPLVCKLQIVNLIPIDKEENWEPEEVKMLSEKLMQYSSNEFKFICKVRMALQDLLITDSFDVQDQKHTIQLRVWRFLTESNICTVDKKVYKLLGGLIYEGMPNVTFRSEIDSEASSTELVKKHQVENVHCTQEPINEEKSFVQETWKTLSWHSEYLVNLGNYKDPHSFLVKLDSTDNKNLQRFLIEIENLELETSLSDVKVGAVCAVKVPKNRRGKILNVHEDFVEVLLVDFAEIVTCEKGDLLELPGEAVSKFPFQTIHCRLIGLRPKYNLNIWASLQRDAIHKRMQNLGNPIKVLVEKSNDKCEKLYQIGMKSYEISMKSSDDDSDLSEWAITRRCADQENEKECNSDSGNSSDVEGFKDVALLRKMLSKMGSEVSSDDDFEEFMPIPDANKLKPAASNVVANDVQPKVQLKKTPLLNYIHKHPKIEWRQNDIIVYLIISAADCVDYGLKINDMSIEVVIKYQESQYEKTVLQLYSPVVPKMCSQERCGLNIIVRLTKKILCEEWPRLTESNERSQFIKFSEEKIFGTLKVEAEKTEFKSASSSAYVSGRPEGFYESDDDVNDLEIDEH